MLNNHFLDTLLPAIENKLKTCVEKNLDSTYSGLKSMLQYHMGWHGEGAGIAAQGKRIRPLLVLLTAISAEQTWEDYLSFAASVELIHNFSLIHDDIEDSSPLRRGRKTLWRLWGVPQALNSGDLLFTIAHLALLEEANQFSPSTLLEATRLVHQTCIMLTQGQYLDMYFETQEQITLEQYWTMIEGKTAALIKCCTELGAIKCEPQKRHLYSEFGKNLGLAFQIQDDLLGLWGEVSVTGKSSDSDLTSGKMTLPVIYALENNDSFRARWHLGNISAEESLEIAEMLKQDGTFCYTQGLVRTLTNRAVDSLQALGYRNNAITALQDMSIQLIGRSN